MTTLQPVRRRLAAASAPVLLALSLAACGGGGGDSADGAPEDASVEEFCTAFTEPPEDFDSDDTSVAVDGANEYGDTLAETGTPADFSDEARSGFEVYTGFLQDVDEDDVAELEESEGPADIFGEGEAEDITTFLTEATSACAEALGGDIEGELGDLESELPSDSPS